MAKFLLTMTVAFAPAVAVFWISDVPWVAFLALLVTAPVVSVLAFRQVEAMKSARALGTPSTPGAEAAPEGGRG